MMNFSVLPPEINSALMFSGAGSGPLLAAAVAWDGLASELDSAAESFSSVTSGLVAQAWQGPASQAIAATESQYEEMWAQDVSAMVGYHGGASAAAAQLTTPAQAVQNLQNFGFGNIGSGNFGLFNTGTLNFGIGNTGTLNFGIGNLSPNNDTLNFGIGNTGTL